MDEVYIYLPDEIIEQVISYCQPYTLLTHRLISVQWYKVILHYEETHPKDPNFLEQCSYSSLYPGIEKYLCLYQCLGRSIQDKNIFGVAYYLRRVNTSDLDLTEFMTLFTFLQEYWLPENFSLLLHSYFSLYRSHFNVAIFKSLNPDLYQPLLQGFPKLLTSARGNSLFTQAPYYDNLRTPTLDIRECLRNGRKLPSSILEKYKHTRDCPLEIRRQLKLI